MRSKRPDQHLERETSGDLLAVERDLRWFGWASLSQELPVWFGDVSTAAIKRVIEDLHLPPLIRPYAYVAVCHHGELETLLHLSDDDYKRLRADLVDLFNLSNADFKVKDLLKERRYDQGNSAHVSLAGGYTIEGHGGGGADGGHGSGSDSARHTPATATLEIAGANIFNACRSGGPRGLSASQRT